MLIWVDDNHGGSDTTLGIFRISCVPNCRTYKDNTKQYMIYLSVPSADSREFITLAKIRGQLSDAKQKADDLLGSLSYQKRIEV